MIPSKRTVFPGITAFPGKLYGKVLKTGKKRNTILTGTYVHESAKEEEIEKFKTALEESLESLRILITSVEASGPDHKEVQEILETQAMICSDPSLSTSVQKRILDLGENAILAVQNVTHEISEKFRAMESEFFRERVDHFHDVSNRLIEFIAGKKEEDSFLSGLKEDLILVARELTPSQMILMDKSRIRGIATDLGGKTGHMAILARNYGIPTVVGLKDFSSYVRDNEFIFLDAEAGHAVRFPTLEEVKYYGFSSTYPVEENETKKIRAVSKDGIRVKIKCNLESELDCEQAIRSGAEGVGLFRSESLFLKYQDSNVSGEEQFRAYKAIAEGMEDKPVTIRTFDIGADKFSTGEEEENPFLGNRGIRYSLSNPEWFSEQLTAILRASAFGNVSILLPMITGPAEIIKTRALLEECKRKLSAQKEKFNKKIKVGAMIETPAAVSALDLIAREADFFSVGTNDLLQYIMAVDRNNIHVSSLYNPYHIAFLRALIRIVEVSRDYDKPLGICGELASDTNFTIFLIGIGIRDLSVSIPFLNPIRKIIRSISLHQAGILVKKILELSEEENYENIEAFLFSKHLS
ncbi:phosphoenolpyruvate--protein phosphotransferase [Leptospira stimsonii]|uniref:Phosphoenolpyruvate-protein phosphotransferase n=1 Tax=Leptospira stimsonii TaxID=2202203 RepID=A0ABY2MUU7_9LEPT|nr:phosphoenolpyruvate--protein phosphotransferase [Leptospira stimsonii]TGK25317.1 phosphoenolpyruvate--protein phosphotransferase [Leptospira stimsonii]TGM08736.1 phosphoenolpyruvate--protein phosphotransferase [Leptospira stimsonii]